MFLLARLKMYLAAAGFIFAAFVAAYFRGKTQAKHEFERDADKHLIDSMRKSREVEDEIETLDDEQLASRASSWVRGNNG